MCQVHATQPFQCAICMTGLWCVCRSWSILNAWQAAPLLALADLHPPTSNPFDAIDTFMHAYTHVYVRRGFFLSTSSFSLYAFADLAPRHSQHTQLYSSISKRKSLCRFFFVDPLSKKLSLYILLFSAHQSACDTSVTLIHILGFNHLSHFSL